MNTTIAKVIAFELGVLIAILAWLAVAGLPGTKPVQTAAAAVQQPAEESFGNVSPVYHPRPQQFYAAEAVDYPNNNYQDNGASPAQAVQTYDQPIASAPYAATFPEEYPAAQEAPNSIGTFPEPVLYSPYDWPYDPYFGYAQPSQIIILSNGRTCSHRAMNAPHFDRFRPGSRPIVTTRHPRPTNLHAGGGTRLVSHLPVASHGISGPQRSSGAHAARPGGSRVLASR
ncbi:MAG TPA: hypothetical protein VGI60_06010 [Chthoniobacterales bacterium]